MLRRSKSLLGTGRVVLLGLGAALLLLLSPAPSEAATAIYYSRSDNVYGWCAGYGYDRAHACAHDECTKEGGKDCVLALECEGGWGAVAFAEEPGVGVGATCGLNSAYNARTQALAACMDAAKTLCWTDATFDGNGSSAPSNANRDFDLIWFTQDILQIRHFELGNADGQMGAQTQAAIRKFQTSLGRQPTGIPDEDLLRRLLDAVQGRQHFGTIIKRDVLDPRHDAADVTYAYASSPAPVQSFSAELMTRPEDQRRLALATILTNQGSPCTLPAKDAEPLPDASSQVWNVGCAEGDYTLMLSSDGTTVIMAGKAAMDTSPKPASTTDESAGGGKNVTAAH